MMQKAATDADEYISGIHCHDDDDDDDVDRFGECRFSICLFGTAALEGWRRRDALCGLILGRWAMSQSSNTLGLR